MQIAGRHKLEQCFTHTSKPVRACLLQQRVKPRQYLKLLAKSGEVGVAVGLGVGVEPWETVLLLKGKKRHLSQKQYQQQVDCGHMPRKAAVHLMGRGRSRGRGRGRITLRRQALQQHLQSILDLKIAPKDEEVSEDAA